MKKILVLVFAVFLTGCPKKTAAPVPGTINTFDAYAARVIGDAQTALTGAKTWEMCSDQHFPLTVSFDNETFLCDSNAGPFPAAARPALFRAEQAYNVAEAAGQAYHAGGSSDVQGLTQALTQLGVAIGEALTSIGKGK